MFQQDLETVFFYVKKKNWGMLRVKLALLINVLGQWSQPRQAKMYWHLARNPWVRENVMGLQDMG